MRLTGFAGPAGCGKTTAARYLYDKSLDYCEIRSFADPLKDCLRDLFDFTHNQLYTLEGKEAIDPRYGVSPRIIMQRFGTEFVRSTVPNLWEVLMEREITTAKGDIFIIDDCRFELEANLIRKYGTLVHIKGRCLVKHDHASEKELPVLDSDIVIHNEGTLLEFQQQLDRLL